MKKTIVVLAIVLMTITSFAQENKETSIRVPSGYTGFLETGLGGVWTQYGVDGYLYKISTTHGYHFNDKFFAGLGVGYEIGIFNTPKLIPFYGSFRYVILPTKIVSPVVRVRAGGYHAQNFNLMTTYTYYHNVTVTHYHMNLMGMGSGYYEDRKDNISNISIVFSLEW